MPVSKGISKKHPVSIGLSCYFRFEKMSKICIFGIIARKIAIVISNFFSFFIFSGIFFVTRWISIFLLFPTHVWSKLNPEKGENIQNYCSKFSCSDAKNANVWHFSERIPFWRVWIKISENLQERCYMEWWNLNKLSCSGVVEGASVSGTKCNNDLCTVTPQETSPTIHHHSSPSEYLSSWIFEYIDPASSVSVGFSGVLGLALVCRRHPASAPPLGAGSRSRKSGIFL